MIHWKLKAKHLALAGVLVLPALLGCVGAIGKYGCAW
jgi:hypothetical protein